MGENGMESESSDIPPRAPSRMAWMDEFNALQQSNRVHGRFWKLVAKRL